MWWEAHLDRIRVHLMGGGGGDVQKDINSEGHSPPLL